MPNTLVVLELYPRTRTVDADRGTGGDASFWINPNGAGDPFDLEREPCAITFIGQQLPRTEVSLASTRPVLLDEPDAWAI